MIDDIVSLLTRLRPRGIEVAAYESIVSMVIEMMKLKLTEDTDEANVQISERPVAAVNGTLAPTAYIAPGYSNGNSPRGSIPEVVFSTGEGPSEAVNGRGQCSD